MSDRSINDLIREYTESSLLRISTAGSVDDGKSTLIGRLLHDTHNIHEDTLAAVKSASKSRDAGEVDFSLVTDGLKAEREQGITIDVAYRYFSTPKRKFILADTPGHEQYTRNMATGASNSNVAIILIDARKGVLTQTKRHSFICSLLGVKHFAIAINKMDLVEYSQAVFERIREDYQGFAEKLSGVVDVRFLPLSALNGDNVCKRSLNMPWYQGDTFLQYLESVYVSGDYNYVDFRFPVQYVIRKSNQRRYYAGQVLSGSVKVGDDLVVLPSGNTTRVQDISGLDGEERAFPPMSIAVAIEDDIDISRGDMLVHPDNQPHQDTSFGAMLVWMSETPMAPNKIYLIQHTTRITKARVTELKYRVDVNSLSREEAQGLALNEIGRVSLQLQQPLMWDVYSRNRQSGSFILIDAETFDTVASGMVIDRIPASSQKVSSDAQPVSEVVPETDYLSSLERAGKTGHQGLTVWFSGLSGSGKTTIAKSLEKQLYDEGYFCFSLDGDNLRGGLNRDLGFAKKDRGENLRRAAEVAKLFNQAGFVVLCAFITPFEADRQMIKRVLGDDQYLDVFVDTELEVCEQRDPKGLYQRARNGDIPEFTGISSPFEAPLKPSIVLNTTELSVEESVQRILGSIKSYLRKSKQFVRA